MARLMAYGETTRLWKEECDILSGLSKFSHVIYIPNNGANVEIEGVEIIPATEKNLIASTWLLSCYLLVRGLSQGSFQRFFNTNFITHNFFMFLIDYKSRTIVYYSSFLQSMIILNRQVAYKILNIRALN